MQKEKKSTLEQVRKELQKKKEGTKLQEETPTSSTESDFKTYLDKSRETDFDCKSVTYIDTDVHDIFSRLKTHTGVKIGQLLSQLGKDFIENNKAEIKKILSNKYLK